MAATSTGSLPEIRERNSAYGASTFSRDGEREHGRGRGDLATLNIRRMCVSHARPSEAAGAPLRGVTRRWHQS
jgi:hypothetical protein